MKCIIPVMSPGSMSYVLGHLGYILILPSPALFKEKEKWFYVTNAFCCCCSSVYLGLYAENSLGALRLWGFVNFDPKLLHHWPSYLSPTPRAVQITENSCRESVWISEKILIHFCFYFSSTQLFFPPDLMGLLQNPKFPTPGPTAMAVRGVLSVSPLVSEVTLMHPHPWDVPRASGQWEWGWSWGWGWRSEGSFVFPCWGRKERGEAAPG